MAGIRVATPTDLVAINSFNIFAGDRSADVQRGECYVALEGVRVAGYVVFNHSFYLKPESRRRGLANELLAYVEGICDGDTLFTSTESDNLPMLRLLSRRGYQVSGVIERIQERAEVVFCKEVRR